MFGGELGQSYLDTEGDEWDAHKDMALAGLGALIAMGITAAINWRLQRERCLDRTPGVTERVVHCTYSCSAVTVLRIFISRRCSRRPSGPRVCQYRMAVSVARSTEKIRFTGTRTGQPASRQSHSNNGGTNTGIIATGNRNWHSTIVSIASAGILVGFIEPAWTRNGTRMERTL